MNDLDDSAIEFMDCSNQNTEPKMLRSTNKLTETSAIPQAVLIIEGMTKSTAGSGHFTYFLRTPYKLPFG